MERKTSFLSLCTPNLLCILGSPWTYLQTKKKVSAGTKRESTQNKQFEKATLRIKGVNVQKKLISCYNFKFKTQTTKLILKKEAQESFKSLQKLFSMKTLMDIYIQHQSGEWYLQAIWWHVTEENQHGRGWWCSTWHVGCALMSAQFMPYATKHSVVSAFFGTQTTRWH